jgi:ABC-type transport system involved in multi-copper enzyme maturation permease subunit
MMNPFHTPFAAVFCNEVRLNTRRVAPYALMPLFIANAVLWWGWGPAVERGWATNSDFYIHRNYGGFAFLLGLPIFNAVIMGDPVLRDLRLNVYPLIFSKPVGRGSFLLGKFFGAFFVLVCCQSTFAITLFVLQWVPFSGMVTLPVRVVPFVKHFFFVVVISHLVLAVFYFAAGTLTRNAKIVYAMAALFYPVYIGAELLLVKDLPTGVRVFLEPFAFFFNADSDFDAWHRSADFLNQYVIHYGPAVYVNRAWMIVVTGLVLWTV